MALKETGWKGIYWIHLAQDMVDSFEHSNEPSGSKKGGAFLGWVTMNF
jgi:hypothetical protein